jgi:LuxR family maltose regulon positive regulatory protein
MADLQREWNDLDRATELMDEGLELALQFGHADALCEAYALLARLRLALADEDGAIEAIGLAEQILADNPVDLWIEGWLDESRVRIWLSRGELAAAEQWAVDRGLAADSDLNFHRDLHHINLARLLLAQGAESRAGPYLGEADRLLGRLLAATGQAGWTHETIMILVLQAVLAWIRGDSAAGTATLAKALALAEPGGYVRTFIDEGRPVRELLRLVAQSGTSTYVGKLLAAMSGADKPVVGAMSSLADPLSERELEVLRLLDSQLSSTKIAGQLFISPNTVRFHMKNIYDKLAVHSRADAVEVARSLNLL